MFDRLMAEKTHVAQSAMQMLASPVAREFEILAAQLRLDFGLLLHEFFSVTMAAYIRP
jgi:hypothetical protein